MLNLVVAYYATKETPKTMESYALANRSSGLRHALVYFQDEYTVGGVMGNIYGPFARVATTIIMTVFSFLMMVGQLRAFGCMVAFLGLSSVALIVCLGLLSGVIKVCMFLRLASRIFGRFSTVFLVDFFFS